MYKHFNSDKGKNKASPLYQRSLENLSKSDRGEISYDIPYMWNLKRNDTDGAGEEEEG